MWPTSREASALILYIKHSKTPMLDHTMTGMAIAWDQVVCYGHLLHHHPALTGEPPNVIHNHVPYRLTVVTGAPVLS